ncbi:MAG: hypothetical protein RL757_451 [Bacteroidota bacterium]|jgi:hypothetical protein
MSSIEKFSRFQTRNNRLRRGSIYLGLMAVLSVGTVSCGDEEEKWETVQQTELTKGVRTIIQENEQGKFEIVGEDVVADTAQSSFLIKYKDGRNQEMSLAAARTLLAGAPADTSLATTSVQQQPSGGSSLSNVLWWGAGGYLLGRALSSPSMNGFYSPRFFQQQPAYGQGGMPQTGRRDSVRRNGSRGGRARMMPIPMRSASSASEQLRSTTTTRTVSRPVSGGRSGFFGGSRGGRSSGG